MQFLAIVDVEAQALKVVDKEKDVDVSDTGKFIQGLRIKAGYT